MADWEVVSQTPAPANDWQVVSQTPVPMGWTDALAKGAVNAWDTAKKVLNTPMYPDQEPIALTVAKNAPGAALSSVGDLIQYARNLSPPEFRGSAPSLGTGKPEDHPYLQAFHDSSLDPIKNYVANSPWSAGTDIVGGALLGAGPAADLTGAALKATGEGASALTSKAARLGSVLSKYDRAAEPIAADIKTAVVGNAAANAADQARVAGPALADQAEAQAEAARRAALVRHLRGQAEAMPAPDIGTIGTVRNPSEIGAPLQQAASANELGVIQQRDALDTQLRAARDKAVAEKESAGETITTTPAYKELVDKLKPVVQPDVATMPSIAKTTDPTVKSLYSEIWQRVTPQDVPLTYDQYRQAEQAGIKGIKTGVGPNGEETYSRTITPTFGAVDDARRFLGQAFANPQSGYSAISGVEKQQLYHLLDSVEKQYVGGGAQSALQKNWADAAQRLQTFDDTTAGKTLTATQGDTTVPRTPASDIPGRFFGKGQQRIGELASVTGNQPLVTRSAADWVASQLAGKTGAEAQAALSPTRALADMLAHPELAPVQQNVQHYVNALRSSETAANRVAGESSALAQSQKTAATTAKQAQAAQDAAQAAADQLHLRAAKYDRLAPRDIVSTAKSDIADDLKAGRITQKQHDAIYQQIDQADALYGKTDAAKAKIKTALKIGGILGVGGTTAKVYHLIP